VTTMRAVAFAALLGLVGCASAGTPSEPQELTVMVSGALYAPYAELVPEFERTTGARIVTVRGGSTGDNPNTIPNRLARGEPADVAILAADNLEELTTAGHVAPGSRADLAEAEVWGAVPQGAPKPDLTTREAFIRALRAAPAVAVSSSVSGVFIKNELIPRLGLAADVGPKVITVGTVGTALAAGEATIGFQNYSELLPIPGIDLVGPLPNDIRIVTVFSAGRAARSTRPALADSFIRFLASPAAHDAIRRAGLEPMSGK